jgi:hypothetical protein
VEGAELWSPEAKTILAETAQRLGASVLVTKPVNLLYDVVSQDLPDGPTLASASSAYIDGRPGFRPTVVQRKVQTGFDSNGSRADGRITWNWGKDWSLTDVQTPGVYDFRATALHELVHTFGWSADFRQPGTNTRQYWTIFSKYIKDQNGNSPINDDFTWNDDFDTVLNGQDGKFYFWGPNAMAANGGKPVPLYTPNPYRSGAITHLDDTTFAGTDRKLMNTFTVKGAGIRTISTLELGVLKDIGYNVVSSPAAITVVGLFFLRRSRSKSKLYR